MTEDLEMSPIVENVDMEPWPDGRCLLKSVRILNINAAGAKGIGFSPQRIRDAVAASERIARMGGRSIPVFDKIHSPERLYSYGTPLDRQGEIQAMRIDPDGWVIADMLVSPDLATSFKGRMQITAATVSSGISEERIFSIAVVALPPKNT